MNTEELIKHLAYVYRDRDDWDIPPELIETFRPQVERWFNAIHVPVRWNFDTECPQPFNAQPEMSRHVKTKGELLMLSEHSEVLGRDLYSKHRAVHDWFGHILPAHEFGALGECGSFCAHTEHYTPDVLPIVFSDVVLANSYHQHFGERLGREKWVYAPDLIPAVLKHFGRSKAA